MQNCNDDPFWPFPPTKGLQMPSTTKKPVIPATLPATKPIAPSAYTVTGKQTFTPVTIVIGTQEAMNELTSAMLALYHDDGTSTDMDYLYEQLTGGKGIND